MLRLYRVLLRLYPERFVGEFGDEMASVLRELQRSTGAGFFARLRLGVREVSGLLAGALRERLHKRDWNRNLSGGTMRAFRFSRWTIAVMILLFVAVNIAIERTRQASVQQFHSSVTAHWWTMPGVMVAVSVFTFVVALIGYSVFQAVRGRREDSRQ